jgi:hypothetical protein
VDEFVVARIAGDDSKCIRAIAEGRYGTRAAGRERFEPAYP